MKKDAFVLGLHYNGEPDPEEITAETVNFENSTPCFSARKLLHDSLKRGLKQYSVSKVLLSSKLVMGT